MQDDSWVGELCGLTPGLAHRLAHGLTLKFKKILNSKKSKKILKMLGK